jgi:hypothetical protein
VLGAHVSILDVSLWCALPTSLQTPFCKGCKGGPTHSRYTAPTAAILPLLPPTSGSGRGSVPLS